MQNLASIWSALDLRKRMVVVAATIGVFLAVLGLTRFSGGDQMALLYAGLDSAAAGEVIAALDQKGIVYEVRGDSIFVEAGGRDSLRMTLAGEGLPAITVLVHWCDDTSLRGAVEAADAGIIIRTVVGPVANPGPRRPMRRSALFTLSRRRRLRGRRSGRT